MKILKHLLWPCIILALAANCNKDPEPTLIPVYEIYTVDSAVYPYIFRSGSYWIYENQANSEIDTVWVEALTTGSEEITSEATGEKLPGEIQYYIEFYESTMFGDYIEYIFTGVISRYTYHGGTVYLNGEPGDTHNNAILAAVHESLVVDSITYNDVVEISVTADEYIEPDMNLYYAKSVGVIRKEIIEADTVSATWNLVEYGVDLYFD